jgi:hypothetical protein
MVTIGTLEKSYKPYLYVAVLWGASLLNLMCIKIVNEDLGIKN